MITNWFKSIGIWIHGHLNVLIGIHQSRSSCLIYITKFVQVISCNLSYDLKNVTYIELGDKIFDCKYREGKATELLNQAQDGYETK